MFQNRPNADQVAATKSSMGISNLLGFGKKEEIDPVIDARLEGLSANLDARLPKKGCFRH